MSVKYAAVQWNRRKVIYDLALVVGVAAYVWLFEFLGRSAGLSSQILSMRAWGSCAFVMLTLILCIGPLARLDRRFVPILYNRRHFGVLMCVVGIAHARSVLDYYYAFGAPSPELAALLTYDVSFTSTSLPFPIFGLLALCVITLMAATSHDFWQRFLGARAWKWLHMSVYVAYALVLLHVFFGAIASEQGLVPILLCFASAALVITLHLMAARKSNAGEREVIALVRHEGVSWIDAGPVDALPLDRARPVCTPQGERIALVRTKDGISAVHGVCAHQGGPLYEAKVIDGCLTCPWHGWQYRPVDGRSPPPFAEKLATYQVRLKGGRVLVDPRPQPAGTALPPARLEGDEASAQVAEPEVAT